MADNRKKGCPNEACEAHTKKIKMKSTENFCSKCGTPLVFVCAKCFKEIEDIDPKHRICKRCEEENEEKKQKNVDGVKNIAKKAGGAAVGAVGAVAVGVAAVVQKDAKKLAVDKGVKIVKDVARAVIKH